MKTSISILVTVCLLTCGCGSLTPEKVSASVQLASLALDSYARYAEATSGGQKISHAQIASIASADLSGIAAIAQASLGKTPAQAGIVAGAANVMPAASVVASLPDKPLTQSTVQQLQLAAFDAAHRGQP